MNIDVDSSDDDVDLDFFANCCIAANKESTKLFYFFYVENTECVADFDISDDYNRKIIAGQNYLSVHYLGKVSNKTQKGGCVYYYVNKKRCAFIFKESIVYPFVPFEKANVKTKMYKYLFLSNEHLCDMLYFVKETKMAALV